MFDQFLCSHNKTAYLFCIEILRHSNSDTVDVHELFGAKGVSIFLSNDIIKNFNRKKHFSPTVLLACLAVVLNGWWFNMASLMHATGRLKIPV